MRKRTKRQLRDAVARVITALLLIAGGLALTVYYPWVILLVPLLILGWVFDAIDRRWKKKGKRRRQKRPLFNRPKRSSKQRAAQKIIEKHIVHATEARQLPATSTPDPGEPHCIPEDLTRERAPLYGGAPFCRRCGERMIMESESPSRRAATFRCDYCGHSELMPLGGRDRNRNARMI